MNYHNYANSLRKFKLNKYSKKQNYHLNQIYDINFLKITHRVIDGLNISTLILIFLVTFLSIYSQLKWTNLYSAIVQIRNINSNLIDYISKTEEYYLSEIEDLDILKKTSSKDLLYLVKPQIKNNKDFLFNNLINGLKDSNYQRGF